MFCERQLNFDVDYQSSISFVQVANLSEQTNYNELKIRWM